MVLSCVHVLFSTGRAIVGVRWKCYECLDYDLCGACKASGVHRENKHNFIQVEDSAAFHPWRHTRADTRREDAT
jgi:hypothetical protein